MSHNKPVLLIGGPADGQRIILSASARIYNACERGLPYNEDDARPQGAVTPVEAEPSLDKVKITTYAIGTVQGAFHAVFHVGTVDHNTCILCELVAGYRKPRKHPTDANVAKQLVTLIGGAADGRQFALPTGRRVISSVEAGDPYHIVPLICRDGTEVRVAVLDTVSVDPISMLIEGYRMGGAQ